MYLQLDIPNSLLDDIKQFGKNQNEIIIEALKSYIKNMKSKTLYNEFETACKELKDNKNYKSLDELIDELENN